MNGAVPLPLDVADLSFRASGGELVRRSVLSTGARVLTESMPGSRSATVGFWVAVGSRDETGHERGSTHFLEHLLFKGTPSRSAFEISVSFESVGGEHNAATAKEYTCYYAKVRDVDLDMAVDVLADMVTSSTIDPDEFEVERGVILDELAMADDDAADVGSERLFESVFGEHPLGRPIGGSPDSIRAARRDDVVDHYRANYRPQDLVVTVAGAVDHEALVGRIEAALSLAGWPDAPGAPVERRSTLVSPLSQGVPTQVIPRPLEQATVLLGVPGLSLTDTRRPVLSILNAVLGGGMSSRLFQEIREKRGLAYSVYSFAASYSDAGLFGLYAGCAPRNAREVTTLLLEEFDRLAADGITDEEHSRSLGMLGGAAALALEDSDTRMNRLGRAEISMGEFIDLDESLARLAKVTPNDVAALAGELRSGVLSTVVVGDIEPELFGASTVSGAATTPPETR
ncbi:M16 family metallopeptidase [Frondihabitans sp. Leaf304]|uniref:M16 family metallopeptidase n=1 Tax=Frondihabitans sp. Leaf304 TaxID=1736329 RepID=UPI0006F22AC9|nr:pitrilysin family protein [Frondihabitans sp. Leaf304]KQQ26474.1 zinc protease [Frondihabitans sp. Leaf304]